MAGCIWLNTVASNLPHHSVIFPEYSSSRLYGSTYPRPSFIVDTCGLFGESVGVKHSKHKQNPGTIIITDTPCNIVTLYRAEKSILKPYIVINTSNSENMILVALSH